MSALDMEYTGIFWMARLKVRRARDLIRDVTAEWERYCHDPPMEHSIRWEGGAIVVETKAQGPLYTGAIVGDVIHNLRTALDLMASEMARIANKSDKNVYFPFADSKDDLEAQIKRRRFHYAGEDAVDLLKTLAPYRGGNSALRALHDLDIQDKHTSLINTGRVLRTDYHIPCRDGEYIVEEATATHDPSSLTLEFPESSPFGRSDVIPTLENLAHLVDGIIKAFVRLIELRNAEPR